MQAKLEGEDKLYAALQKFSKETNALGEDLVIDLARTGSRQLANNTEPWGLSKKSETIAKKSIAKDVNRAYAEPGRIYVHLKKLNVRLANAYSAMLRDGDEQGAIRLASKAFDDLSGQIQAHDPKGSHLEASRGARGRVTRPNLQNLTKRGAVALIVAFKIDLAGIAKAAWLQAGQSIGSNARIPAWLMKSRNRGESSIKRSGWQTVVTITNLISYVSNVLTARSLNRAITQNEKNTLKKFEKILAKNASKV